MSRLPRALALLCMAACLLAGVVRAEEGGTLRGLVTDKAGTPLPGATVTVRSKSNPSVNNQGTITNAKGEYRLPLLPAGNDYEVTCAFPGLATIIKRPIDVDAGKVSTVDFILTEELVQVIRVEAKGDIVDTEKTTTSTAINTEFIAGLPILGRTYSEVLTLAPGVTDTDGDGNPNVKGAREVDFQLRISGVQVNDPFGGERALDFNIEAIEEIQILTGALSAEYSSQGGVGAVTTKSGGNEFEGSFKIFYQSRSIDGDGANNHDITQDVLPPPSFRTLRPFLTAGGAFKKDRLWYYTALEYIDEQEPIVFGAATKNTAKEGLRLFGKGTWQINPEHKTSLELYYEPTDTAGNNIGPTISEDSDLLIDSIGRLYTLRETAVFSPTVFLDSTLSLFTLDNKLFPVFEQEFRTDDDIELYQIPGREKPEMVAFIQRHGFSVNPVDDHYLFDLTFRTVSGPFFLKQQQNAEQFTLREDLSFYVDDFLGSHTLKAGLELQNQDYAESTQFRPLVLRSRQRGGVRFFDFQVPLPAPAVDLESGRLNFAFYVQDTWKPIPNLTVNLGVRLDREVVNSDGRSVFDPRAQVDEYNRVANLYYASPGKVGNVAGARGQFVLPEAGKEGLNFRTNPVTDRYFCDLDGDGTCNGFTSPTSPRDLSVLANSDTAILRSIFSRNALDCDLVNGWNAAPGLETSTGLRCTGTGSADFRREGADLSFEDISLGNTNVAPRVSVSFDPFADGKTKLYGTYGWFYGSLFLDTVVRERRQDFQSFRLRQSNPEILLLDTPVEGAFTIYQVSRDLRTPYTREFTVGLERELAPELAIKVIYTDHRGRNQLQDVDINHTPVDRRGGENGGDGIFDDCVDGFAGATTVCNPDGMPDLEVLNPNFNQIFLLGNFNESKYRSLELVLTKRLHRNWQFETSYTYSVAEGNAEEFLSLLGDDPSQTELEEGFLSYDQRHLVKFNAIAHLPKEFSLGGSIQYESGLPYSLIRRDLVLDDVGNNTFRTIFPTGRRNDQRNKAYWTFNANLKKGFTIGGRVKAVASFDVFDLLNSDDLRIFSVNLANTAGLQISDPVDPAQRQFGRRFQMGIELHF